MAEEEAFFVFYIPGYYWSLSGFRTGTQGRSLMTGIEVEIMEEHCLLVTFPGLAGLANLYNPRSPA